MRKLNKEDIILKNVDTIGQYKILDYLKKHLNINEFDIYIIDRNIMKVIDSTNDYPYFFYNEETKDITYSDELETKNNELEI